VLLQLRDGVGQRVDLRALRGGHGLHRNQLALRGGGVRVGRLARARELGEVRLRERILLRAERTKRLGVRVRRRLGLILQGQATRAQARELHRELFG
jgi:hypothetical protein